MDLDFHNQDLFPLGTTVDNSGNLEIGGCSTQTLVRNFGTPLYVYDETTIRLMCRTFIDEFSSRYPNTRVAYASKAFLNTKMAKIINGEGLGFDVVSGGEIAVTNAASVPPDKIYFHGNNKTPKELDYALESDIGTIVVDGFHELEQLEQMAKLKNIKPEIMLRLSPSVDAHTHHHTTTGILDVKFGFSIETGESTIAIRKTLASKHLDLKGIHFHLGSPLFDLEPYSLAIDTVLEYLAPFMSEGLHLREFSTGGGFAIGYVQDQPPPPIYSYAEVITSMLKNKCQELGIPEPLLVIEPGRAIAGRAGVALYSVGVIKHIPAVRTYVSLDGGMGDNIRPALYGASYEAVAANRMNEEPNEIITLAGKYCETGDILIKDIALPELHSGDIVAIPSSGAYCFAMSSNYNMNPRPAIVLVKNGEANLIRRRETYEDLTMCDLI